MHTPILIFGAKEKGKIALEIFQSNDLLVYGLLDDDPNLRNTDKPWNHATVLGTTTDSQLLELIGEKCHPFVALEEINACQKVIERLAKAKTLHALNAIHKHTTISKETTIGAGNIIHVGTSIGPETTIGHHCTLYGHNFIGHDVHLHDFVSIGTGTIVNAGVTIHEQVYIGSGAVLQAGITIGAHAQIAPGAVVLQDIPQGATFAGNPAQPLDTTNADQS